MKPESKDDIIVIEKKDSIHYMDFVFSGTRETYLQDVSVFADNEQLIGFCREKDYRLLINNEIVWPEPKPQSIFVVIYFTQITCSLPS